MVATRPRGGWRWTEIERIAALGEPLLELQPAEDGGVRLAFGGDVANSMICLSRMLGAGAKQLALVTALGDSSYSAWLRQRLTARRSPCHGALARRRAWHLRTTARSGW